MLLVGGCPIEDFRLDGKIFKFFRIISNNIENDGYHPLNVIIVIRLVTTFTM